MKFQEFRTLAVFTFYPYQQNFTVKLTASKKNSNSNKRKYQKKCDDIINMLCFWMNNNHTIPCNSYNLTERSKEQNFELYLQMYDSDFCILPLIIFSLPIFLLSNLSWLFENLNQPATVILHLNMVHSGIIHVQLP